MPKKPNTKAKPARYNASEVEAKWQKRWEQARVYEVDLKGVNPTSPQGRSLPRAESRGGAGKPYYTHVMFPYPSGETLHVGHWYNFGPADSFARFKRMQGYSVFSPMGFDAFGLPAENHAVKTGVHPAISIKENVETMTRQLKRIGCMYDWSKTVNTSESSYFRWTQWLFLQMFRNGLAYQKEALVNFCPSCKTVLANEQVWEGKCERCESDVILKPLRQWFLKITNYAQRLLDGLEDLDWPEKTKLMQRNWIGRSEGVNIQSKIKDFDFSFYAYDSVPQTYCAQTFSVIAPEHPILPALVKGLPQEKEVLAFAEKVKRKKATERYNFSEDLDGVFTGRYVSDPFGTGDLPIFVASFVVMEYGSGIVHCSAHDERDFAFAKKFGIPLRPVMFPENKKEDQKVRNLEYCFAKDPQGILEKPEEFRGRRWGEVRGDIIRHLQQKGFGEPAVHYRLRDWSIGRQRYWGAPIPIVYDPEGKPHEIPEKHLPWLLPTDVEFKPKGTSPLAQSKELKQRAESIFGKGWTPEVDTMDTFVDSSFYSLMYLSTKGYGVKSEMRPSTALGVKNPKSEMVDRAIEKKWLPVDCYIGGAEHACMHLIYARFIGMALKDFGFIEHSEQYKKLVHQGVITNKGSKMSKSKGNVVSPDGFVERYGSDVFRMYLMFMGPFTEGGDWSDTGITGVSRFVQRIWKFFSGTAVSGQGSGISDDSNLASLLHRTIKKVTEDIEKMHFNTALSALMIFLNEAEKAGNVSKETAEIFVKLLAPLAPHLAEELWGTLHKDPALHRSNATGTGFVINQQWPSYDESKIQTETVTIAIQVNGKVRGEVETTVNTSEDAILAKAKEHPNVSKYLEGKKLKKEMYIEGKLVSLVV